VDFEALQKDPRAWAAAGGAALILLVAVVLAFRRKKPAGEPPEAAAARRRRRLLADVQSFRDEMKRAVAGAGPVFRKVETETEHAAVVGHWRRALKHRIAVRSPDFGALKAAARGLGFDSMAISDLEAAWRKAGRQIADYNAGKTDDSRTPIATVKGFEKDLEKVVLLANICVTKYGG